MRSAKAKAAVALKESAVASEGGNTTADSATEDSGTEEEKRKKGTKATKRKAPPNKRTVKRRGKAQDLEEEEAQGLKAGSHQGSPKSVKEKEASTSEEDSCGEDKENESEDVDETEDEESVGPEDVPPDAKRASCGMLDCDFEGKAVDFIAHYKKHHKDFKVAKCPQCKLKFRMLAPLVCHVYKDCYIKEEADCWEKEELAASAQSPEAP